ncbi:class I SAM-dependent methyltransferase [Pseudanabaena sp. FACHB-1277]|uniref:Class I SAM-dependent methyltransferase n=1 Tax=Pseudanabaena cinerea FACHB-1277 TaxID=2949581 RepID=A0A926US54_9CYAN|nr:class I SAM-dependent methyltransferase [Pseudanabaena cinerea]MBD2150264.1 class I SAM-dependent methyltransferase [Pseudanabaena cinerea FACHB-1277]
MSYHQCRFCKTELKHTFVDLGMSPLSNSYLKSEQLNKAERFYPLHAYVCDRCLLVQLEEFESPDHIFSDYAYFSSYSDSWLKHCHQYANLMIERFGFNQSSQVMEIASNDGYLLQYFQNQQIPVLGIEPAANVAKVAIAKGISTVVKFFGVATAQELVSQGKQADLLLGNNVLAHVPDINDFVAGMQIVLKPDGIITMEFPHVLQLMQQNQFDTIYHEHFSYLSLLTVSQIFTAHGLTLFDVEELPTHGGSLRIYAKHQDNSELAISDRLIALQAKEKDAGLDQVKTYLEFGDRAIATKHKLLNFLIEIKRQGKTIVGYGAPAKGNTLLNYCGIRTDFLEYTCDRSPHKQGLFLPGTHIPIHAPDQIKVTKPDYVLILPWNLKDEIQEQLSYIREWGGHFIVPIPEVEVLG